MKVIVSAPDLTVDDYEHSGCDQALHASARRWNTDYLAALSQRIQEAETIDDMRSSAVSRVLFAVVAAREPWNRQPEPADDDPVLVTYGLDAGATNYLQLILNRIADDEVRARAADLLYKRSVSKKGKRDFHAAEVAVDGYLAEASRRESALGNWCDAEDRIERAFTLAVELRQSRLIQKVVGYIDKVLSAITTPAPNESVGELTADRPSELPSRFPAQLMKLLIRFNQGSPESCGTLAERLSNEAIEARQWDLGRAYLDMAAGWYTRAGDSVRSLKALERCAEAWVEEGQQIVDRPDASPMTFQLATHRLLCGVQALREVKGRYKACGMADLADRLGDRITDVRRLHLQYAEHGVKALVQFRESTEVDLAPVYAVVDGKSKIEALFAMAAVPLPTRMEVEKMVRDEHDEFVFARLFGLVQLDERGKTTAHTGSSTSDSDIAPRMYHRAVTLYTLRAQLHITPHMWKILSDHAVDLEDFLLIAHASPFIPPGRERPFARGLYAGMCGDFVLALHLLIPQLEQAVRIIVRSTLLSADGSSGANRSLSDEDAPTLPEALCQPANVKALGDVLGDDVVFALRTILVERFGGNTRHRVLHGLTAYGGLQDWLSCYLWWLVFKICCMTPTAPTNSQQP